jgi:hypothetical protein
MPEAKEETTTHSFKQQQQQRYNQSTMCHFTMHAYVLFKNTNMTAMPNVWLYELIFI